MAKFDKVPLDHLEANEFVRAHHRHLGPVVGDKFRIGAALDGHIVGVVIVGRPLSRARDDGMTLEITRLCTDGTKDACSFLYGAAVKAAVALGYSRIGTYIREGENGASLRAAGLRKIAEVRGRSWNCGARPRVNTGKGPNKELWEPNNGRPD